MACKCKIEIEAKLHERFKSASPEARNHEAELDGYTMVIQGDALVIKGCMAITTRAEFPVKKSGTYKAKKVSAGSMVFTFCPFCGKRYDEVETAGEGGDCG